MCSSQILGFELHTQLCATPVYAVRVRTKCPYYLDIATLNRRHAMTTETTPVRQIYLVKLKYRALQNVLCAHRTCTPRRRPPAVTAYPRIPHTKMCSIPVAPNSLQLHRVDSYKLRKQTPRSDGLPLLATPHAREKSRSKPVQPQSRLHTPTTSQRKLQPQSHKLFTQQ